MNYFNRPGVRAMVKEALKEDLGKKDITTISIIQEGERVQAVLLSREECVICGLNVARQVFKAQDEGVKFNPGALEGEKIKKGRVIARLSGRAQGILSAERVALNFLSLLSGIATKTREYVEAVRPYGVKIMDTRKTIPLLRGLEKYAVRVGGGYNHRFKLDEMILVKDNHIKVLCSKFLVVGLEERIKKIQKRLPGIKIEIEVENLKEFRDALRLNPDIIMLDNMNLKDIKKAVEVKNQLPAAYSRQLKLEASGGIDLRNVRKVAACGVDMISVGELTHSVNSVDLSLEIV